LRWIVHDLYGGPVPAATDKLQMLQSKHHAIVTNAPWCVSNMQIHASLAVPFFADHITALTENFASKLSGVWHQLVWCLGRRLCWSLWGGLKSRTIVIIVVETVRNKLTKSVARLVLHALVDFPDWAFVWFSSVVNPEYSYRRGCAFVPTLWGHQPKCPPSPSLTNVVAFILSELNPKTSIDRKLSFHRTNWL